MPDSTTSVHAESRYITLKKPPLCGRHRLEPSATRTNLQLALSSESYQPSCCLNPSLVTASSRLSRVPERSSRSGGSASTTGASGSGLGASWGVFDDESHATNAASTQHPLIRPAYRKRPALKVTFARRRQSPAGAARSFRPAKEFARRAGRELLAHARRPVLITLSITEQNRSSSPSVVNTFGEMRRPRNSSRTIAPVWMRCLSHSHAHSFIGSTPATSIITMLPATPGVRLVYSFTRSPAPRSRVAHVSRRYISRAALCAPPIV